MTRREAKKVVAKSGGGICVQYIRRPDGRIQTIKNTLHQITRQTGIAAGILGTSLSLTTMAYAQSDIKTDLSENAQVVEIVNQTSSVSTGTISGTISDPNAAAISLAFVTISCDETNFHQSVNANREGFYELKNLPRGTYKLKFEADGFESKEILQVTINEDSEVTQNAQLDIQTVQAEVVIGGESDLRTFTTMGVVAISESSVTKNKLILAVRDDNLEEVKSLIYKGKRVNVKDRNYDGNSPLHIAAENGNLEIAEVLLNAGAKVDFQNSEKRTPLMMLDEDATPELVNLLLRHGAKIDLTDKKKNTALILASSYTNKEVIQALIYAGANVNAVNKRGETALMNAAENDDTEVIQLLLGSGADANARNREGKTALSLVKTDEAKQYLIAYGAIR
jgi:ankyrin repeat protein